MKFTVPTALALMATKASAQEYNTSKPFTLKLTSCNGTINGQFLGACHAGAAIEELCLNGKNGTADAYNTFALNTTDTSEDPVQPYQTGILVWTLEGANFNESEGLVFNPSLSSNVVAPEFWPSASSDFVGFDDDDKMFIYSSYYDDSKFTAGEYPKQVTPKPLYHVSSTVVWLFLSFFFFSPPPPLFVFLSYIYPPLPYPP